MSVMGIGSVPDAAAILRRRMRFAYQESKDFDAAFDYGPEGILLEGDPEPRLELREDLQIAGLAILVGAFKRPAIGYRLEAISSARHDR